VADEKPAIIVSGKPPRTGFLRPDYMADIEQRGEATWRQAQQRPERANRDIKRAMNPGGTGSG